MNSRTAPVALFRTAAHDSFVTVRATDTAGQYDAACDGCGWTQTCREAMELAGAIIGQPAEPLAALRYDANLHALSCTEMPRHRWPGNQALGRW